MSDDKYISGHVLFVRFYDGEGAGYFGFIHPYGASGRKQNVFFTDKQVTPALDALLRVEGQSHQGVEVTFRMEQTRRGPRALEVFLR